MSKALDTVINDPDIKTVVLSARWHYFVNSKNVNFQRFSTPYPEVA